MPDTHAPARRSGPDDVPTVPQAPGWGALWRVFGRIGLLSFGGPAAQIALMHRELVERRHWLDEGQYLRALSFCMLLPGPEAMQLATYAGWRLRGVPGGLLAGLLFVVPGALVVLALAAGYVAYGDMPLVQAMFLGVKACVVVIVVEALLRVSRRALNGRAAWWIAALAFAGIFAFGLPFPLIVALAAAYGFLAAGGAASAPRPGGAATAAGGARAAPGAGPGLAATVAVWGAIWLLPLAALWWIDPDFLFRLGLFFSRLAVVTFGGAYAVLAYMTQDVVGTYGWLTTDEMVDGLGLAETTPGPLILVTEFVGYVAGARVGGGGLGGVGMGLAGAATALWMTFAPCFLWIFAGAPYIEALTARPRLAAALAAITAAVVGVILNLSVWFGLNVLFGTVATATLGPLSVPLPDPATLDLRALAIALAAAWALLWRHLPLPLVLAGAAAAGLVLAGV